MRSYNNNLFKDKNDWELFKIRWTMICHKFKKAIEKNPKIAEIKIVKGEIEDGNSISSAQDE